MILKYIRLNNIRSYLDQRIEFPNGSIMLSGDIGSGKSTILLAVEFALFGLKKGDITGSSLLRHGKKEGYVELGMEIDEKDIIVRRYLKRTQNDIKQEAGYIITNGIKKDGTSEELKSAVLNLLGYSKEFLKKKEIIYRYTVYTPQEDMKRIIYEDRDVRLDTLRKVFNIDKYDRIVENSRILINALREKKKSIEGFILDIEQKREDIAIKKDYIYDVSKKIDEINPKLNEIVEYAKNKKGLLDEFDSQIKILNSIKTEINVLDANLEGRRGQIKMNDARLEAIERNIETLRKELDGKEIADTSMLPELIKKRENEIFELEREYRNAIRKMQEIKSLIQLYESNAEKIISLEQCPMCQQNVTHEHKNSIKSREEGKIKKLEEESRMHAENEKNLELNLAKLRKEKDSIRKKEAELSIIAHKAGSLEERLKEKEKIIVMRENLKNEYIQIENHQKKKLEEFENVKNVEKEHKTAREEYEKASKQEKLIEIEKAKLEKEIEVLEKEMVRLIKEIDEKENARKELNSIISLHNWTSDFFVNLVSTIEKHSFMQLHNEFNNLFREWFQMLMEDETISARLDDEFSPVMEQNGYETFIDNLSGGEKTSVALAYRLALNKVINDVVNTIKTKDIIILDEPTDGFSSEQLDKVREVLEQLNMKQIIIVSHESKIESFVQNVIRISKEGHVSSVI